MAEPDQEKRTRLSTLTIIISLVAALVVAVVILSPLSSAYLAWDRGKGVSVPKLLVPAEVHISDLRSIVDAMSRSSETVRYAGLTFGTPDRPSDDGGVNLNLTFENERVGFDWVLLAPRNIEDQEKFRTFARAHGFEPVNRSMNGVSYLRVESGDIAKFTASIVTEMYDLPANEPLGLFHEGFGWPQK